MNKVIMWVVLIIIIIGGGYWYMQSQASDSMMKAGDMGSYAYTCDSGESFTMTPSQDVSEVSLSAASEGLFTGSVRLAKMGEGVHFETTSGDLIVLSGAGEEVQLTAGDKTHICNLVPSSDMAPWNWGDAGEGAGAEQDISLAVSQNIVGRWQSTQDTKSVRVFKSDYTVDDIYDGKVVSTSLWVAFTKLNAPEIVFPLEDDAVYVQITENGTVTDTLTFKVTKLTPEELELIYMDRGGALTYKSVK